MVRRLLSYASWMEYPVRLCFVRGKSSNIHKHKFIVTIREMLPYGREHLFFCYVSGRKDVCGKRVSNLLRMIFQSPENDFPISCKRFFVLQWMIFHSAANDFPPWAVRRVRCCGECAGSPCLQYEKCRNRFASFRLLLFQSLMVNFLIRQPSPCFHR